MAGGKITVRGMKVSTKQPAMTIRTLVDDGDYSEFENKPCETLMEMVRNNIFIDKVNINLTLLDNPFVPFTKKQYNLSKDLKQKCRIDEELPPLHFTAFPHNDKPIGVRLNIINGKIGVIISTANKDGILSDNPMYTPDTTTHEIHLNKHGVSGSEAFTLEISIVGRYNPPSTSV